MHATMLLVKGTSIMQRKKDDVNPSGDCYLKSAWTMTAFTQDNCSDPINYWEIKDQLSLSWHGGVRKDAKIFASKDLPSKSIILATISA